MKHFLMVAGVIAVAGPNAQGQAGCRPLAGTVEDSTAAVIPGAKVTLEDGTTRQSGSDGRFRFACVAAGVHRLAAEANGFAVASVDVASGAGDTKVVLVPSTTTVVDVAADAWEEVAGTGGVQGSTVKGDGLQQLADDPDDLQRELQQLAAQAGGSPGGTILSVDGFQDDATLPPKSSIAFIRVNPDLFSAEYREPPFEGGRVEIFTKPGASAYHGALFATNSSPGVNARDPYSVSKAAIGKQRYGFEFNGPVRRQGSNFTVTLEHRSIDNFAVVNAVTLDGNGNAVNRVANVATPQRLWVGTARLDWQLGPKNIAFVSYGANVNHVSNLGVGGTALPETGLEQGTTDHAIRFSDVTTVSAKLVHEARGSVEWRNETDVPASTAAQVEVAGSFTGGGSTTGLQFAHGLRTEWDDDVIVTAQRHLIKAGWQFFTSEERRRLPTNLNGTYVFGGGTAPVLGAGNQPTGASATITGLEQYRRAQLGLAGGTPTQFSNVTGDPEVDFNQIKLGLFAQDDWKLRPDLTVSFGFRYYLQNDPLVLNGATPRASVSWSPDKKKNWNLNAHAGLFAGQYGRGEYAELEREDGVRRVTSLVYNPVFGSPLTGAPTVLHARRTAPGLRNIKYAMVTLGVSRNFAHGWNINGQATAIRKYDDVRTVNVNSPLNGQPTGPRPLTPNVNVLQLQNSGRGLGDIEFGGIGNQTLKRVQFFFGAVRINARDDTDDNIFNTPQSAATDAGEFARRTGNGLWQTFGNLLVKLPGKVQVSANYYGQGDPPYNVTTGFDNNGDGDFNDRPQFAAAGQAAGQSGAVATQYGLLVASGGTGVLRRNLGNLPWAFNLDMNVQRTFALTRDPKAEHRQTLTANVRSSNVLNHLNVTAEGGVLGSPLFGVPFQGDNGRRVEGGLRYAF